MWTCKKYYRATQWDFSMCFACLEKKREEDFYKYWKKQCSDYLCTTIIPWNRSYCSKCYKKNMK